MQRGLVVMCLVAACGGQGVDLEVTSEVAIDRVELFVANEHCYKEDGTLCEGVAWQTLQPRPPGEVYVMKGDETTIATTTFDGGRAVMHLEATSEFRQPKYIAIIGFAGETAVSYALMPSPRIPANTAETWRIELKSAGPATAAFMIPPAPGERYERVHAWKRERVENADALSRCLALQFWHETNGQWEGLFIVPDSDPDCDGRLIECDPLHANFNVGGDATTCVTPLADPTTTPCVIGAALCEDGVSPAAKCISSTTALQCVPQALCHDCADDPGLVACATVALKTNPDVSRVECTFNANDAGTTCGQGAQGSYTQITLPVPCAGVEVRSLSMPFSASSSPTIATVGTATIVVSSDGNATGGCAIDLKWTQGAAQAGTTETFAFFVKSTTTANTIALPVRITWGPLVADCGNITTEPRPCVANTALGSDTMLKCLQGP